MKKTRRFLLLVCSLVLLVSITVGVTVAYLTDTESVKNTFTIGNVAISLSETKVGTDGKPVAGGEVSTTNAYHLIPGQQYIKDPTITVDSKSDDCYVVAEVVVSGATDILGLLGYTETDGSQYIGFGGIVTGGIFDKEIQYDESAHRWEGEDVYLTQADVTKTGCTLMVYWKEPQSKSTKLKLFEYLNIPSTWSNTDIAKLNGMQIEVTAYAVQYMGFDDVFAAYTAGKTAGWKP